MRNEFQIPFEYLVKKSRLLGFKSFMEFFERELLFAALRLNGFNKAKTAEYLKINRTTLIEKVKRLCPNIAGLGNPNKNEKLVEEYERRIKAMGIGNE